MRTVFFLPNYGLLLVGVLLGLRETSYPLSVKWRWRHRSFINI